MSKYFIKYLPIEGEIKKGDKFKDGGTLIRDVDEISKVDKNFNLENLNLVSNNKGIPEQYRPKKVKMYLCSRDIQVGDKVKIDNTSIDYDFTDVDIDEGYQVWNFHNGEDYKWYCPGFDKDKMEPFKIIGEVSPEAVWVTGDMEFEYPNEVKLKKFKTVKKKQVIVWKFKCPNCKHFH